MSSIKEDQNNNDKEKDKIPRTTNNIRYKPIHKEINNVYQLSTVNRERVLLAFKEAIIKGFEWQHIPTFIETKTNIKVTQKFIETLKRLEYLDNKDWYYTLARDNFAYVGVYRRCIDELELARQELWHYVLHPKVDHSVKVQSLKEIHNIVKTQVLLLRDLPFVMNLSKYYDVKLLDPDNNSLRKLGNSTPQPNNKEIPYIPPRKDNPMDSFLHKAVYGAVNKEQSSNFAARTLDELGDITNLKDVDTKVMNEMQKQFGNRLSPEHKAELEKQMERDNIQADAALSNVVNDIEATLRDEFKTNGGKLDTQNVKRLIEKSQSSLSYLDSMIEGDEQEKATVARLKELTEREKGDK